MSAHRPRELRSELTASASQAASPGLPGSMSAGTQAELEGLWQQFSVSSSLDTDSAELGQRVFEVRAQQLAQQERTEELGAELDSAGRILDMALTGRLDDARANSNQALESSVARFSQGRIQLAVISLASVGVATVAAASAWPRTIPRVTCGLVSHSMRLWKVWGEPGFCDAT